MSSNIRLFYRQEALALLIVVVVVFSLVYGLWLWESMLSLLGPCMLSGWKSKIRKL